MGDFKWKQNFRKAYLYLRQMNDYRTYRVFFRNNVEI